MRLYLPRQWVPRPDQRLSVEVHSRTFEEVVADIVGLFEEFRERGADSSFERPVFAKYGDGAHQPLLHVRITLRRLPDLEAVANEVARRLAATYLNSSALPWGPGQYAVEIRNVFG